MTANTGVFATRLANGLGVLLKEDHSAPIASVWTWYRVGSRNESPGTTGVSHWVEHMQFKGTPTLAKGQVFRDVSKVGGTLNALTSHDWTAYFETLPAAEIDLALRIESDRMVNSLFDADEVESERTVILSERQGAENNPGYVLYEETLGAAFHAHPYRHMVIGYEHDLRRITRADLFGHYQRYYHPANAFIVAVGAFSAPDLLGQIEIRFGSIPAGEAISTAIAATEPPQPGQRRVLLHRPSGAPYLRVAFHAPAGNDPDLPALLVADAVLSGGKPMGFGGSGGMGRSSRLYRALVASGLARAAGSDIGITIDPYLFQIGVSALPGGDLGEIERIVTEELQRLKDEPVPAVELERAKRQFEAQFVYSAEGVTNQAYWLGQWEIVDSWKRALSLAEECRAVTSADVQRVAQVWLDPARQTVGWLVPTTESGTPAVAPVPAAAMALGTFWGLDGPRASALPEARPFFRETLPNGIAVLGQERPESRSVALRLRVPAGSVHEDVAEMGLAHLTARSLLRGSAGMSFAEISARGDDLGSSLGVDSNREFVDLRVRCLRDDLPEMIALASQTLLLPDFPEDETARVRAEQLGSIAEAENDTRATADRIMRRAVYPEPNPLGRRVLGTPDTVRHLDRDAVQSYYSRAFHPDGATAAVVGGFGTVAEVVSLLSAALGSWQTEAPPPPAVVLRERNTAPSTSSELLPGKSQADLAVGVASIPRHHPDYYALDVANLILGRLGLMGRLGAEVRDRQGLAYYAYSQLEARRDGSLWSARAGVAPGNIDTAVEAVLRELAKIRTDLVSEEELADARRYLVGVLPLALESHDGVAATLLAIEEFGLGLDYLDRYPEIIAAVSVEQVRHAAATHLDPERIAIGIAAPL